MQTEIEKRIEEELDSIWNRDRKDIEYKFKNFDTGFQAGAKFILEMPELREAIEALNFYREYSDCAEGCRSRSDSWVLKCTCGFVAKEKIHRPVFDKLKALGIVKDGE